LGAGAAHWEIIMPYLQLDVSNHYPEELKRRFAQRAGNIYAEVMETTPDLVAVAIRELGPGGLWQCTNEAPVPGAILSCESRRGRSAEYRLRLGAALTEACRDLLGLDPLLLKVEFTQHAADEIYGTLEIDGKLQGGLAQEWTSDEVHRPLVGKILAERAGQA
jgi:phenylpyruvate tautomerase PptA (4-oxalocrotonate tautomerase family)